MAESPEAHTAGLTLRADFTGTPDQLQRWQQDLHAYAERLGARAISIDLDLPLTYPPGVITEQLEQPIDWVTESIEISPHHVGLRTAIKRVLEEEQGLRNLGDILMLGANWLEGLGPLGPWSIRQIENRLGEAEYPIALRRERGDAAYVAHIADDLSQVPVQVVLPSSSYFTKADRLKAPRDMTDFRVTIQDALRTKPTGGFWDYIRTDETTSAARRFARHFRQHKRRQTHAAD